MMDSVKCFSKVQKHYIHRLISIFSPDMLFSLESFFLLASSRYCDTEIPVVIIFMYVTMTLILKLPYSDNIRGSGSLRLD